MDVNLLIDYQLRAMPEEVFVLGLDPERFPPTFRGCGPIPAIERIVLHGPPAVGSTRELHNSDGSQLRERITAYQPPNAHAYTLDGLRPPLAWLVRAGHAQWILLPEGSGSHVRWTYRFELTSPLVWPLAYPLLKLFMATAMRRCLRAMDLALSGAETR